MAIVVGLSIPFRTLLSLDTDLAGYDQASAASTLTAAACRLESLDPGAEIVCPKQEGRSSVAGVKSLDQHGGTWFSTPLFEIRLDSVAAHNGIVKNWTGSHEDVENLISNLTVRDTRIYLFDNTVGVAIATVEIPFNEIPSNWSAQDLELFLSEWSEQLVYDINNRFVRHIIVAALEAQKDKSLWSHKSKLIKHPKDFLIFDDLNSHKYPSWNKGESPFLWSHRAFVMNVWEDGESERAKFIMRFDEIKSSSIYGPNGSIINVGTSFVGNEDDLNDFQMAATLSQYFYCLFNQINISQNRLYHELSGPNIKKNLSSATYKYDRVETLIGFVRNEFVDAMMSLQGKRNNFVKIMTEAFGVDNLTEVISNRTELLNQKIDRAIKSKGNAERKFFQFALFLLGATQVLSIIIDLFDYSNSLEGREEDGFLGLLDLLPDMSFDLTINIFVLVVVIGALIASLRVRK